MKKYTVIFLYPDGLNAGNETWCGSVDAGSVTSAKAAALAQMYADNGWTRDPGADAIYVDPGEIPCVAVFEGVCEDIKDRGLT